MFEQIINEILDYYRHAVFDMVADETIKQTVIEQFQRRIVNCDYEAMWMTKTKGSPACLTGLVYTKQSTAGRSHVVNIYQNRKVHCTCESFRYRHMMTSGYCKHLITLAFAFAGSSHLENNDPLNDLK